MIKTIGDTIEQPTLRDFIRSSLNLDESLQATATALHDHILLLTNYRVIVINSCDPGQSPDGVGFETTNFLLRDVSHIDVRLQSNICELEIVSKRPSPDPNESSTIESRLQFANQVSSEVAELADEIEAKNQIVARTISSKKGLTASDDWQAISKSAGPRTCQSNSEARQSFFVFFVIFLNP